MSRAHGCAGATISRLVSSVPRPRVNLTRFHGVFAPNSKHRALITPARWGRGRETGPDQRGEEKTPFEHRVAITWAQRLKRVFAIDVETFGVCGGTVKVIASIENPLVIRKILDHLEAKGALAGSWYGQADLVQGLAPTLHEFYAALFGVTDSLCESIEVCGHRFLL